MPAPARGKHRSADRRASGQPAAPADASGREAGLSIASYNLFGESTDLPDVVHCEPIAARSVLHDWEFRAHRHARLHQLLLLTHGGGRAHLEGRSLPLRSNSLVNVPIGSVHAFSFARGTQGWVVTIAGEMLDEALTHAGDLRRALSRPTSLHARRRIGALMLMLAAEFAGRSYARAQVLRGLTATLLGLAARQVFADDDGTGRGVVARGGGRRDDEDTATNGIGLTHSPILPRFEALVEAHHLDHWGVADYAQALAVTPTHLSRITRQATGQPASRLIDDRLMREARRQLVYTNLQVATIAYALGFADPAHFSRVFSRSTGASPRAFRQQRSAG